MPGIEDAVSKLMNDRREVDAMESSPEKTKLRTQLLNEFEKAVMYLLPFAQMANISNSQEPFGYPSTDDLPNEDGSVNKNLFLGRD